jgi:hypothetical protein
MEPWWRLSVRDLVRERYDVEAEAYHLPRVGLRYPDDKLHFVT